MGGKLGKNRRDKNSSPPPSLHPKKDSNQNPYLVSLIETRQLQMKIGSPIQELQTYQTYVPGYQQVLQNGSNQNVENRNDYVTRQNHRMDDSVETELGINSLFKTGDIVVARYDFEARSDTEVSFHRHDRLVVNKIIDHDWSFATHTTTGTKGYIPINYFAHSESLDLFDWYFGTISRRETESLMIRRPDGTFLIRASVHKPGEFVLSLKHNTPERKAHLRHYVIAYNNYQYSIWKKKFFANLNDLVEDYKVNTNGLPILLKNPCPKPEPIMADLSLKTRDEWEIDRKEISLVKIIGQGNFGEVYYGMWQHQIQVAVKTLKKGAMPDEQFLAEATIMKGLKHENILSLYATCSKEEPIYIITQYMKNGSLLSILKQSKEEESIPYDQMLEFGFQISKGMLYLEKKNLIHRDLAARNVLVDDAMTCKIADFGLAKIIVETDEHSPSSGKFPVKWSPPEVLVEGKFSIKSDVWSFGIVMIEIFTYGDSLYPGMNQKQVKAEVVKGYRLNQPPLCPTHIYELLLKCWDHNPDGRPSFRDLKEFFDESCHKPVDGTQYLQPPS